MKYALLLGLLVTSISVEATVVNCPYKNRDEFNSLTKNNDVYLTILEDVQVPVDVSYVSSPSNNLDITLKSSSKDPRKIKKTPIKVSSIFDFGPRCGGPKSDTIVFNVVSSSALSEVAFYSEGVKKEAFENLRSSTHLQLSCSPKKIQEISYHHIKEVLDGLQTAQDV